MPVGRPAWRTCFVTCKPCGRLCRGVCHRQPPHRSDFRIFGRTGGSYGYTFTVYFKVSINKGGQTPFVYLHNLLAIHKWGYWSEFFRKLMGQNRLDNLARLCPQQFLLNFSFVLYYYFYLNFYCFISVQRQWPLLNHARLIVVFCIRQKRLAILLNMQVFVL